MANFCVSCQDEFIDSIVLCPQCKNELVNESKFFHALKNKDVSKKLDMDSAVVFFSGPLNNCKDLENIFKKENFACAVYTTHKDNCSTGGCSTHFSLYLNKDDVIKANDLLKNKFAQTILKEGQGEFNDEVINLEEVEIKCPACGERSALENGECRSCGLFLGERP